MLENIIVKYIVLYETEYSYLLYNDRLKNSTLLHFKNFFPVKHGLPYHTYGSPRNNSNFCFVNRKQHTLPHLPLHRNNPRKRCSNNRDHPKRITRETIINPIVQEASVGYPCSLIDATRNYRCK